MNKVEALESMFNPSSVAIAGVAPAVPGQFNTGQLFLDTIVRYGFKGEVYPVNPRGGEVSGRRIYANVRDVPGPVDYLISCIPAAGVPQLIEDCAAKGVKAVCLFTAGFSETGSAKGRHREEELSRLAETTGVRVLGPNCMGVYSPKGGLSFSVDFPREAGHTAVICQSGGNTLYLVRAAAERGVRFSKVISYGNGCDIDETDLLEYFLGDVDTRVVAAYIEGVKDGSRFHRALKQLSAAKPVAVLKAGRTHEGAGAAASHTGSLAGSDEVWDGLLEQAGAVRVYNLDELVDMMVTFQFMGIPRGRGVGLFGVGGGASVLATDDCSSAGFMLPRLSERIRREITRIIGTEAGTMLGNPVDILPMASSDDRYQEILRALFAWEGVDFLLFHVPLRGVMLDLPIARLVFDSQTDNIVKVAGEVNKPSAVVLHYLACGDSWKAASAYQRKFYEAGLPVYHSPASAFRAIDRLLRYHQAHTAS